MNHGHSHKHRADHRHTHVGLKIQQLRLEGMGSEELEDDRTYVATPPTGSTLGEYLRQEDERHFELVAKEEVKDSTLADSEASEEGRPWVRQVLLRSRAPVVVVRLRDAGEVAEPYPTFVPRSTTARQMLDHLCDFLRDRFGTAGREAIPDSTEWGMLLGRRPSRPTERLSLLARLAVTGQHKYDRTGGGNSRGSDLGLNHYLYKFAALPDGTAFSVRLLLAGGKSGAKGSAGVLTAPTFDRLPVGIRLLALAAAMRREREELRERSVRDDEGFRVLLRDEAARLLGGVPLPAIPVSGLRRFREWLKKNGLGHLFPKTSDRKRLHGEETT
jgi:hypothetical protein